MDKRIKDFKTKLITKNLFGLALDIDETLSNTRKHWFEFLMQRIGNPENLTLSEMMQKYRYSQDVPYWQTDEGMQIMEENRHNSELQLNIELMDGAQEGVYKVNRIIPVLCYLSARPESVLNTTEEWLEYNSFPKAEVFLKPVDISKEDSYDWKSDILNYLYPNIVGIVDDNPKQIESLISKNYAGRIWAYGKRGNIININSVEYCDNWNEIYSSMTSFLTTLGNI